MRIAYIAVPRPFNNPRPMKYVTDILRSCVSQPLSKTPWTTGMNAERPSIANDAERISLKLGVRNRGFMVNIPHPIALIVAYLKSGKIRG